MKVLLDTCIIVDALQNRVPHSKVAQKIFLDVAAGEYVGCISAKSVTDIYYLMHKFFHDDRETRIILKKIFSLFAVMAETAARNGIDYIVTRNLRDYSKSKVKVLSPSEFLDLNFVSI